MLEQRGLLGLTVEERAALREQLVATLPEPKIKERKVRGKNRAKIVKPVAAERPAAAVREK